MNILEKLNSGALHAEARAERPECVDQHGNVHHSAKRRAFVDFAIDTKRTYGDDHNQWPRAVKKQYRALYASPAEVKS